jgi:predicted acetyltransferase
MKLRAADAVAEAAALGRADQRAFHFWNPAGWESYFSGNDFLHHAHGVLVVEDGGTIAGQCAQLAFDLRLGARDVRCWGVAAVGVAPEYRHQGVTDKLMREVLRRARRAGVPFAFLNPVTERLYRRYGYETVEWRDLVTAQPGQLPASPLARQVQKLDRSRDAAAIEALYERRRERGAFRRNRYWWDERIFKDECEWAGVSGPGGLAGYVCWDVPREPGFPFQHVQVKELVASSPESYRALVGFLAQLGDQYQRVELILPRGHGLSLLREHEHVPGRKETHAASSSPGVMGRLVDVAAGLALASGGEGKLGLDVEDGVLGNQALDVSFGARGPRVVAGQSVRSRLALDVGRLAQIVFSAVPASQLLAQGLITGDAAAAARLDVAFAGPGLHLGPANYF